MMPTTVAESLIDKLRERQDKEGLSDQKFGGKLGISKELWRLVRTGERQIPRPVILKGIARAYPELVQDVLFFLGFDVDVSLLSSDHPTAHPETHQDKQQDGLRKLLRCLYLKIRHPRKVKAAQALKSKSGGIRRN